MKKEDILKHIKNEQVDFKLLECVTSTNDVLKQEALNGASSGTVIAALEQSCGRGRRGKSFISKKGGMYLSILIRPDSLNFDTTLITSATAVAVAKAIEEISGNRTQIKWVNDVLINGKKVCGILCESCICGMEAFVIVGVGINMFVSENGFDDEIKDIATTVFDCENTELQNKLTAKVIDNFFDVYNAIESKDFLTEYRKRSIVLGKEVYVHDNIAKAIEIDDMCRLKVEYQDGRSEYLSFGEISIQLK